MAGGPVRTSTRDQSKVTGVLAKMVRLFETKEVSECSHYCDILLFHC